jgi:hypothetical protein
MALDSRAARWLATALVRSRGVPSCMHGLRSDSTGEATMALGSSAVSVVQHQGVARRAVGGAGSYRLISQAMVSARERRLRRFTGSLSRRPPARLVSWSKCQATARTSGAGSVVAAGPLPSRKGGRCPRRGKPGQETPEPQAHSEDQARGSPVPSAAGVQARPGVISVGPQMKARSHGDSRRRPTGQPTADRGDQADVVASSTL